MLYGNTISSWSNPSVLEFAAGRDPVATVVERARGLAYRAMESGWSGPPFDPFELAEILGLKLTPRDDIGEGRLISSGRKKASIEYNPTRPVSRIRFTVCHEIAHTFFPDHAERIRYRGAPREALERQDARGDSWQLELLCNIGAAELLMPIGMCRDLLGVVPTVRTLLEVRDRFQVSTEAVFHRAIHLAEGKVALFAASPKVSGQRGRRYGIDYLIPSADWTLKKARRFLLPSNSVVGACTAIDWTAAGEETWPHIGMPVAVDCVGVAPYPSHKFPRVLGLIRPPGPSSKRKGQLAYEIGDAIGSEVQSHALLCHVVNDTTPNWGAGFAKALARKWPHLQREFRNTVSQESLTLGDVHFASVPTGMTVAHMVAQHGYGPSEKPRIRYASLQECLLRVADRALKRSVCVRMPRIGSGHAGGAWPVVEQLIKECLVDRGVSVTVYTLERDLALAAAKKTAQYMLW